MVASRFVASAFRFKGRLAVIATAVSSLVMICAVCISRGFSSQLRSCITEMTGDVCVFDAEADVEFISGLEGVLEVRPVVRTSSLLGGAGGMEGVVLKGAGKYSRDGIIIPSALSSKLAVEKGDTVSVYFMDGDYRSFRFAVSEVREDLPEMGGGAMVFCNISYLREILGLEDGAVTGYEVLLDESLARSGRKTAQVADRISSEGYRSLSSRSVYPGIFDWIDLIGLNTLVILILMSVVASFNMISALLIMILRSTREIGTMKALGMNDGEVSSVFLNVSAKAVAGGLAIGNGAAILLMVVQQTTHICRLDPANYFLSYVPVSVNIPLILAADAVCFALIMLLQLLPTLCIAGISPSKTVRS